MKPVRQLSLFVMACSVSLVAAIPQALYAQTTDLALSKSALSEPAIVAQSTGVPLSSDEVLGRLDAVPVFAILSENNSPVLANIEQDGEQVKLIGFWLDRAAAQVALNTIQTANPEVGSRARMVPIAMSAALRMAAEQQEQNGIRFRIWPSSEIVETAIALLRETDGEEIDSFPGVPLFFGQSDEGVLTIEADGSEVVPFFFSDKDLQDTLDLAREENSDIADKTEIRVTSLDSVMNSMVAPDAEASVQKIEFVPSRLAIEDARGLAVENQSN
ncbi:Tic22 family protein [Synechococcus sp. PCC 7336]|uniref:Tic22 family protein n=1 Tax=Synechococcus sp. PCC 7336 TaxID=195250 RepID=UPI000373BC49|nr:Tic22 family protein [Synechococcus sp. PCC 7336]